ncbi:phospholipid phosphatase 1-like isoform X3 [Pieris brassicae]|uniref:phospholipid phosphatase 1-like isoform X3 n=1 Tax=Pieris brassicae TaxID=7116 RepID=UPI001E66148C|nr:phospholipid phosphatase 1-like isoform X3 [Pieris brassicae]
MDIYKKVFTISKLLSKINRWYRAFFIFVVAQLNLVPGGQVGFQCNDPALSHPYTGDTVNWKWLIGITILLPLVVLLITERQQYNHEIAKKQAFCWCKEYLYGFLLNLTIVQAIKLIVGSPRPHFFETCEPNEALTCKESEYVSSYTCTTAHWLQQSNKSFPSGHTSLAVYAAVFITISTLCNDFYCSSPKSQVNKEQDMPVKNETDT